MLLSDASQPSGSGGAGVNVSGTITFSGLTVELCNETQCFKVADEPTEATVRLADESAEVTIANGEVPAGTYSRVRLTATSATIDLSAQVGSQQLSAQIAAPQGQPVVIEKEVEAVENPDGSRTYRIKIEAVRTITIQVGTGSATIAIGGDTGSGSATIAIPSTSKMTARLVASDASAPAGTGLSGTVRFSGLTIELWDGQQWLLVTNAPTEATIRLGDETAEATLMPANEIPAGTYSKVRLTAREAVVEGSANGIPFSARLQAPPDRPFVLEKEIEVTENPDGSRTFRIRLEIVRTVTIDPASGTVQFNGDLGSAAASTY